jgi:hypothetical protein
VVAKAAGSTLLVTFRVRLRPGASGAWSAPVQKTTLSGDR